MGINATPGTLRKKSMVDAVYSRNLGKDAHHDRDDDHAERDGDDDDSRHTDEPEPHRFGHCAPEGAESEDVPATGEQLRDGR